MINFSSKYYFVFLLILTSSAFGFTDSDNVLGHYQLDESYTTNADILSKIENKKSEAQRKTPFAEKSDLDRDNDQLLDNKISNNEIGFDEPNIEQNFPIKLEVFDQVIYKKSENPWAKKSDWERINSNNYKQNFKNDDRQNFNINKQNYNVKLELNRPF